MNEDDVANFIRDNPEFFRRRPWLLASIDLPDPHDGRAVSLPVKPTDGSEPLGLTGRPNGA